MKLAHRRHRRATPLLLPLPWSRYMYELLCLNNSSSSKLISYNIFDYFVISQFYIYHSIILSHGDSIDWLEYIILFYYITLLILYYSHYHIIHILLFSLFCHSCFIQLCYYYIMILWYYYITILIYYYIIQLIFCRQLLQGVVTVCPTLVHPPPYCPSPCCLWRRRIKA